MVKLPEEEVLEEIAKGEVSAEEMAEWLGQTYLLDHAIASSSLATPEILVKLALSLDRNTRRQVILNAATPVEVLIKLAPEFPQEFFAHPLLDLMFLENPRLLYQLDPGVLRELLRSPDCPAAFLSWACRYGYKMDQLEILKRDNLSVEHLRMIALGPHPKAAERAKGRLIEKGASW